ncbi:restriction endonuclease subunit S [Chryseobacterium sp. M5]|uniref:restriction endonuclease subunit S n=1 Tax=Chryseobacterium sp. M5 TaxID=3379128 RepID=UPI0038573FB3
MKSGKIKSKFIQNDIRFNAGFFLNSDAFNSRIVEIKKDNCFPLEKVSTVWNPPIFKRQFCSPSERAVQYCQSSDVTNALEGSEVYINKIQAIKIGCIVKEKQILVTGFGTIGNTRLVNELSSGISYANNVCRITVNDDIPYGFIYAFLTSKYGKSQLNKNASGSVVRYIEAPGIKKTLVPILPEATQQKIHNLIVDASNLRVEANKLLKEAVDLFEGEIDYSASEKIYKVKINNLTNHHQRLDATYNADWFDSFYENLSRKKIKLATIADLSLKVFTPGIFKRVRTQNSELGIPFLSGSDLLNSLPKFDIFLSKKMKKIDDYILKDGWLAIQDAGTIGYISYINKYLDGVSATNNLIRVIPKTSDNYNPYIFTFFKTKTGQQILKNFEFGSVQKHIDNYQISTLRIPIFDHIFSEVITKVSEAMEMFGNACFKEKTAINLIEKEIDLWQQ